ncbi:VAN3-binding protein [Bienertia sinuspersici]
MAMASTATLVAARCVEAAEAMGAERQQLASAISSPVNVQSHGDFITLVAAAATVLLLVTEGQQSKARVAKEVFNAATVLPVEKDVKCENRHSQDANYNSIHAVPFGQLYWKIVSVYIECKSKQDHDVWTQNVLRLLSSGQ